MITILVIIVTLVTLYYGIKDVIKNSNIYVAPEYILAIVVLPFISFAISAMVATLISININQVEYRRINNSIPLYSLYNETGINGHFILGSGHINSTEYYYSFVPAGGGFDRWRLPAANCRIFLQSNSSPYMTWQTVYFRPSKWVNILPWPKFESWENTMYYLYVPTNTIIQKFELR